MSESDRGPTADALRDDLREVAARADTADPPTARDYEAHGEWAPQTAVNHLDGGGSWPGALDTAGLDGDAARERRMEAVGADALVDDLRRVAGRDDTADPPLKREYDAYGECDTTTVNRQFGSWSAAIDAAGLDGDAVRERRAEVADPDALREDLRRVADRDDTGDPPTIADYRRHGERAASTVTERLGDGSWPGALDAAGLDGDAARRRAHDGDTTETPEAELLAALRDLAATPGTADPPTVTDMRGGGRHSPVTYREEFGSWPEALDAAGLDGDAARERANDGRPERITRADLLADLERVAGREDTGDPPTVTDYDDHGEYSTTTVYRRLGSWGEALAAAGLGGDGGD